MPACTLLRLLVSIALVSQQYVQTEGARLQAVDQHDHENMPNVSDFAFLATQHVGHAYFITYPSPHCAD